MMNASNHLSLTIALILAATGCGDDHDHASHTSTGAETSSTDSSSQGSDASTDTTTDGSGTTTGATTHDSHTSTDATTHDSHDSHDSHTTADSDTATGGSTTDDSTTDGYTPPSPADYCACMLDACHDLYHATWGEDHIESEQKCLAAAEATPSAGMATMEGDFIECRAHFCEVAAETADEAVCESAIGGGVCQ